ncbi:MAG: hydrogenase/urease maturation nickel metallochaperone HypA, partial [Shewanella sp.]
LVIHCLTCQAQSQLSERSVICPHCASYHTRVIDGEDMLLMQLEMALPEDEPPVAHIT